MVKVRCGKCPTPQWGDEIVYSAWRHAVARKDGDLVFLTDDKTIVDNIRQTNTIFCAQRQAVKKIVDEEDLVKANIASFGDDIGKVTNRITAMFDLQAQFDQDSEEYSILDYRIKSGQLFQQNAINLVAPCSNAR